MMKNINYITILTLMLTLLIGLVDASGVTITLTPNNFDRNTEPSGPNPNNIYHSKTFIFNLSITGLDTNAYYDITATLETTKYTGTMANYGNQIDEDLKFHGDDYVDSSNGSKILVWQYDGVTDLSRVVGTDPRTRETPTLVVIRCYDYGPKGK